MNGLVPRTILPVTLCGTVQMEVTNLALVKEPALALLIVTVRITFAWIFILVIQYVYQRQGSVIASSIVWDRLMSKNSVASTIQTSLLIDFDVKILMCAFHALKFVIVIKIVQKMMMKQLHAIGSTMVKRLCAIVIYFDAATVDMCHIVIDQNFHRKKSIAIFLR
jgi:hypothetical protein